YRVFWDVHAWAGVVSALLLYVMFFMGTFALFYKEIDAWANDAISSEAAPPLRDAVLALAHDEKLLGEGRVFVALADGVVRAYPRGATESKSFLLRRGRFEPARSELGTFVYTMHYLGPIPGGIYLAGFAAMALLLTLVTGLLIHYKDLIRQWLQFR